MKTIKIVGVPEHFNMPWYQALESNRFEANGIDLQWTDIPEGTGKMCQMLREGTADIAVILTEGIIKDIEAGNPSSIVQIYVESPLIWGIHVAANSLYQSLSDLQNTKAAISRFGSGSHLMAYINAQQQHWNTDSLDFHIVNTIDGAIESLDRGTADYFMWERFMTQPLVDRGIFRRVGECPTPWPCFVIAVRNKLLDNDRSTVQKLLSIINSVSSQFKNQPNTIETLAKRFHQKENDLKEWLTRTTWSQTNLTELQLMKIQNQLFELNIIDKKSNFESIVSVI
ncbi:MAG: hypothetical protein RLZZ500_1735 [Bacteroidota bacterium]|jgi:ABC-type nitrate/sulfonate/bicarbonate transport system substrate-binding protein